MTLVFMTDDGIPFDGMMAEHSPLGGAEAAFVSLAEAFAARGHQVIVCNKIKSPIRHNGVYWTPIDPSSYPEECDLYIGNRGHRLIGLLPQARREVFWLHNPGRYLLKPRYLWPLLRHRPVLAFAGPYHASTVPGWVPNRGRAMIPLGLAEAFRGKPALSEAPPPRAIFTSNPLRGLDWLLNLWEKRIAPAVPQAELHLYSGAGVYGAAADKKAAAMNAVLERADRLSAKGVRRHEPVGRDALVEALRGSRVMLYGGDPGETFCLSLAEAQALGVPAVVRPLGAVAERVQNGVTGTVAADDEAFAKAAIALLSDEMVWRRQHEAALAKQQGLSWDDVAQRFEALIP